jgi:hypothetical protein
MSIDELGRAAAAEARHNAASAVDTGTMLDRLHRMRRRRTAGSIIAALAVAAAVVAGGLWISRDTHADSHHRPASTQIPRSTGICADPEIRCLGADSYRFPELPVTITLTLPANFQRDFKVGTEEIEGYRSDINTTGVTVTEHAMPAKYGPAAWIRDPAAGTTAASMARWLSNRPFLIHTTRTRTTVDGRPAWHVTGDLKPGAALPAAKDGGNVAPTLGRSFNDSMGYRADLTGQYTLLDLPGAGVTVIWSWTLDHDMHALAANQAFIDGLSFG